MRTMFRIAFSVMLLVLICTVGCEQKNPSGVETHYVEGRITLDGAPLTDATVNFVPKTEGMGEDAAGRSNAQGVYKLSSLRGLPEKGAMAGEYVVTVKKNEMVKLAVPRKTLDGEPITEDLKNLAPEIYATPAKTPLKATVTPGKNKIDLELKSK